MSRLSSSSSDKISSREASLINKQHSRYSSVRAMKATEPGASTPPKDSSILSSSVPVASPSSTFMPLTGQPTRSADHSWPAAYSTSAPTMTSKSDVESSNSPDGSSSVSAESSAFPTSAPTVLNAAFSQSVLGNATVVGQTNNQELSKGIVVSSILISVTALVAVLLTLAFFLLWRKRRVIFYWQEVASTKAEYSVDFSKEVKSDVDKNSANMSNLQYVDVSPDFELQSRTPSYSFSDYWESKCSAADDRGYQDESKPHTLCWETSTIASGSTNVYSECDADAAMKVVDMGFTESIVDQKSEDNIKQQTNASSACVKPKNPCWEDTINIPGDRCTDPWENSTIASLEDFSLAGCEKN